MIDIAINPNTKTPSVAIRMTGYFGMQQDGIKLVDSETVFPAHTVTKLGEIPSEAFATLQLDTDKSVENPSKQTNFTPDGKFAKGNSWARNGKQGRPSKTPLTDLLKEVMNEKHYEIKGTGQRIQAMKILAERIVDKAIEKGDSKMIEIIFDRIEGKVTNSVRLSGAIGTATTEESLKKLREIFPDDYAPSK